MATYKGKDGSIEIGANSVAELESFDFEITVNEIDRNVMGEDWTDVCPGQKSASGSLSCLTDPGDAAQASLEEGQTVTATFYPTGDTTGLVQFTGEIMITSVNYSTAVGDLVKTSINWRNKGALVKSTVA